VTEVAGDGSQLLPPVRSGGQPLLGRRTERRTGSHRL